MNKGHGSNPSYKIDGQKLRAALKANNRGMSNAELSEFILKRGKGYITDCIYYNRFGIKELGQLCAFLGLKKEDYIVTEEAKEEQPTKEEKQTSGLNLDNLIVGLNQMYNLQNNILAELKSISLQNREIAALLRNPKITLGHSEQDRKMLEEINSNVKVSTEKVKAIFTEVKYNK